MIRQGLRFAPLVRVSSEKQEQKGESLKVQRAQIISYVDLLKGVIPATTWKYSGQEHATPDQERVKLDQLLADAEKGLFDAVIVCDPSRWSRDNQKNEIGLQILRRNKIKFFVGTTEYDLFDPNANLFLSMSAVIGQYQARNQSLKSILTRIKRAQEGRPSSGALPFGRTWSEKDGWGIDEKKRAMMVVAARRYIAGDKVNEIAKSYNWDRSHLYDILKNRCGTEWECSFVQENININEKVTIRIPELLDEATREAIQERIRNNIKYVRGNRTFDYLLGGMIFCRHCGYAMVGTSTRKKNKYYRHSPNGTCKFINRNVPAIEIENSVLLILANTFGDYEKIQKAIERATPDLSRVHALRAEQESLLSDKKRFDNAKNNLIKQVALGTFNESEIAKTKEDFDSNLKSISDRLDALENELSSIPKPEEVRKASRWASKVISNVTKNSPQLIFDRPSGWKRKFLERTFSGTWYSGERLGVYVDVFNDPITFEIKGIVRLQIYVIS